MAETLTKSELWKQAVVVFCFVSTSREPSTRPLLELALAQGKTLCVPRTGPEGFMEAVPITGLEQLAPARFGLLEPAPGLPALDPGQLDLVIAPYYRVEQTKPLFAKEEDSYETIQQFSFLEKGFYDKQAFAKGLMKEPASFYYGVMWNKLYRRDMVQSHGIQCSEELCWSEDLLFNLEYIRYAARFYALDQPVYYYVKNPQSLVSTQVTLRNTLKILAVKASLFAYYKDLYEEMGLYEENKLQIFKYLVATAEA